MLKNNLMTKAQAETSSAYDDLETRGYCIDFDALPICYCHVVLPDGRRSGNMSMADPEHELCRVVLNGQLVYGSVNKVEEKTSIGTVEDFRFAVEENLGANLNEDEQTMADKLQRNPEIQKLLQNTVFAHTFYGSLVETQWNCDGHVLCFNARSAGKIVSNLRGKNECYADFFGCGTEKEPQDHIIDLVLSEGLELYAYPDRHQDVARAQEILETCESRPEQDAIPLWFAFWIGELGLHDEQPMLQDMLWCCYRGQATLEEWEEFYICFALLDR